MHSSFILGSRNTHRIKTTKVDSGSAAGPSLLVSSLYRNHEGLDLPLPWLMVLYGDWLEVGSSSHWSLPHRQHPAQQAFFPVTLGSHIWGMHGDRRSNSCVAAPRKFAARFYQRWHQHNGGESWWFHCWWNCSDFAEPHKAWVRTCETTGPTFLILRKHINKYINKCIYIYTYTYIELQFGFSWFLTGLVRCILDVYKVLPKERCRKDQKK